MSQSVAKVWAADLVDVLFTDAVEALRLHYRERPDVWLQPGHVLTGARLVRDRRERTERLHRKPLPPPQITLDRAEFERLTREAIEAHRKERGHD